ncbi:MAG: hypothetical protein Q8T08_06720 [Ignavibacteria bacterium]|jgi:uncharacterized membrane protein|nr:hypothetical protein [Ignavibacteria bacterium]
MGPTIAVFIPIIFIIVTGIVILSAIYFKSREKQLMMEKGLSAEQIYQLLEEKQKNGKTSTAWLKIGIIAVFFGIGLGFGFAMENATGYDEYMAVSIFVMTGLGFITSYFVSKKIEAMNESKEK